MIINELGLNKTLDSQGRIVFILLSIAFISLFVETLSYHFRGIVGFVLITLLVIFIRLSNKSDNKHVLLNGQVSKVRTVLILYLISLTFQSFIFGAGLYDWRFLTTPIITIIALYFASNHLYHVKYFYKFFNILLLILGIQALIGYFILKNNVGIAREEDILVFNFFIIGGPSSFALKAMLVPFFIWFSLSYGSKLTRFINVLAVLFIVLSIFVSTYATSILFIVFAIFLFLLIIILFPFNYRRTVLNFFLAGFLIYFLIIAYRVTYNSPLFQGFYYRLENVIYEPTSWGYSGADRKESRWDKNLQSLREFYENPLIGNQEGLVRVNRKVGGHSSLFDSIAAYGIFGGGGILVFLNIYIVAIALRLYKRIRTYSNLAILISTCLFFIGGIVNPFWEGYQPAIIILMLLPQIK